MFLENAAHDIALNADAAAVNDSNFLESRLATLLEVFFHDARNVFRMKRMEIDGVFERKDNRIGKRRLCIRITSFKPFAFVALVHRKRGQEVFLPSSVWILTLLEFYLVPALIARQTSARFAKAAWMTERSISFS